MEIHANGKIYLKDNEVKKNELIDYIIYGKYGISKNGLTMDSDKQICHEKYEISRKQHYLYFNEKDDLVKFIDENIIFQRNLLKVENSKEWFKVLDKRHKYVQKKYYHF